MYIQYNNYYVYYNNYNTMYVHVTHKVYSVVELLYQDTPEFHE